MLKRNPNPTRLPLFARLWSENLGREHRFEPLRVEGTLPAGLRGTIVRNGPALFEQFGTRYTHPFEGDGALTAIRLDGAGGAIGQTRITESEGLREERAAKKVLYGLAAPWGRRVRNGLGGRQKNTANTNVMTWQGRLFALMEAARPMEIDPVTLDVMGESDLGGVVGSMFSAHPHRVEARRATYNFGLEYGRKTRLHCYELPDEGPARRVAAIDLPYPPMLHDFIATPTHLVFFLSPIKVSVPRLLLQVGGFTDMFQWRPELGTEVIAIPIDTPVETARFTVDAFHQWHFVNAFDRGGELVVDYVRNPDFSSFGAIGSADEARLANIFSAPRYHRAVIDPRAGTMHSDALADLSCEFPRVHPAREGEAHGVAWVARGDLAAIARIDPATGKTVVHELPAGQRASEPIFVPRPGSTKEDDGWLLVLHADEATNASFLAVYDAERLPDGPVARAWFDQIIPITFHGTFIPGTPS